MSTLNAYGRQLLCHPNEQVDELVSLEQDVSGRRIVERRLELSSRCPPISGGYELVHNLSDPSLNPKPLAPLQINVIGMQDDASSRDDHPRRREMMCHLHGSLRSPLCISPMSGEGSQRRRENGAECAALRNGCRARCDEYGAEVLGAHFLRNLRGSEILG